MCAPVLIAAILEELGYLDEEKEKGKKEEADDEGSGKDHSGNSSVEQQK